MTIRIVTDSTCDLPADVAAELDITVIPDYINTPDGSYLDGVDLTRQAFYERLPSWKTPPTTAAPGLGVFQKVYGRLEAEGASAILSLHPPDRFSNLANVARLAAAAVRSVPVTILTGNFLSLGGGFTAMAAARAGRAGCPVAEVVRRIQDLSRRTYTFAGLDTLEYLRRSGRVPHLVARLGGWLRIFPVLKLHLDEIDMDLVRTRARGIDRVIHLIEALGPLEKLGIVHSNVPERAQAFRSRIAHLLPAGKEAWIVDITPVLGAHIGPGALGLAAVRAGAHPSIVE
jgi:DegV family protein with EDD domain